MQIILNLHEQIDKNISASFVDFNGFFAFRPVVK